jgi:4-hydroxythreonine-4-phosphate dehydrogenase
VSIAARGRPVLAVTSGEPAGVGPELCARLAGHDWPARVTSISKY